MAPATLVRRVLKPAVFAAALVPLGGLVYSAFTGGLGPNPIEKVTHETGDWTLRFLLFTLSVTPLRALTGLNAVVRFRRMLGLFAFFYGSLHLVTYLWFDKFFAWSEIVRDVPRRPFITMGFFAFVLLVPLAATSTTGMIRRLGGRTWQRLHRLIYLSALAGVIHFWWLVKADVSEPRLYAIVLGSLLIARVLVAARRAGRLSLPVRSQASTSASR
jgi:sulfoxide reductase heme-binding subunit YedZ